MLYFTRTQRRLIVTRQFLQSDGDADGFLAEGSKCGPQSARPQCAGLVRTASFTRDAAVDIRALTLLDQDGKPISLRAFEGRTLVLHFIFTHCVAACHTQVKNLAGGA